MEKLNSSLLNEVMQGFNKKSFVPMPGGQTEPVAGASQATAAMQAPMGAAPQGQPAAPNPELDKALQDPNVQQVLTQAGFAPDGAGSLIDPATGQPMPPDQAMQVVQQLMSQGGQQDPNAAAQDPNAQAAPQEDPISIIATKLDEILAAIKDLKSSGGAGGAAAQPKKQSVDEKIDTLTQEMQRTNETLRSMTGQQ